MKHLVRVIGVGLALWLLGLIWLDLNRVLLWPLFVSLIAGMIPAYLLGWYLSQLQNRHLPRPTSPPVHPTRPTPVQQTLALSAGPTRPSQAMTPRKRSSNPTRPMPVAR
jgi:hypothetical protein